MMGKWVDREETIQRVEVAGKDGSGWNEVKIMKYWIKHGHKGSLNTERKQVRGDTYIGRRRGNRVRSGGVPDGLEGLLQAEACGVPTGPDLLRHACRCRLRLGARSECV